MSKPSSPQQELILRLARGHPGISLSELAEQLSFGWGSLYYHIRKLRADRRLQVRSDGKRRRVYATDARTALPRQRLFYMSETARTIALAIIRSPGCSMRDLQASLDLTPRVIYYHVDKFVQQKLVTSDSATRYRGLRPSDRLFQALDIDVPKGRRKAKRAR